MVKNCTPKVKILIKNLEIVKPLFFSIKVIKKNFEELTNTGHSPKIIKSFMEEPKFNRTKGTIMLLNMVKKRERKKI